MKSKTRRRRRAQNGNLDEMKTKGIYCCTRPFASFFILQTRTIVLELRRYGAVTMRRNETSCLGTSTTSAISAIAEQSAGARGEHVSDKYVANSSEGRMSLFSGLL